ncbi:MAG: carbamoyltransferase C-terminal domain-containing protein [Myxococcota bacterium]|nr:carbamoyltransferase C-terminal domain-containing protein [Myxococcota bacterium]
MILGLCDGHDAGAALLCPEAGVVFAVSEERLTRRKHQTGFPRSSVAACLRYIDESGLDDIEAVALAEVAGRLPLRLLDGLYKSRGGDGDPLSFSERGLALYSEMAARYVPRLESWAAQKVVARRLRRTGVPASPQLIDHHRCHAWSAAAGRPDALVLTLDAFGDGLSGSVFRLRSSTDLERVEAFAAPLGPAMLFGQVTAALGFGMGEEGKVVARSASGDGAALASQFQACLSWDGSGFSQRMSWTALRRAIASETPEDVAAALQRHVEQLVVEVLRSVIARHGGSRLCLAGGLFANVAVNRVALEIARELGFEETYVFPAMGDSGLCVGAAHALLASRGGNPQPLSDPRIGPGPGSLSAAERATALSVLQGGAAEGAPSQVAAALLRGEVVGLCRGRMEFGPRALGSRSLLFLADELARGLSVNAALGRDPKMPFGPLMTDRVAPRLLQGWSPDCQGMTDAMTVALPASSHLRAVAPGAVHLDGTARAQVLRRDQDPELYAMLRELPDEVCVNTSLNLHGEPIVDSADAALRSAGAGGASLLWLQGEVERA